MPRNYFTYLPQPDEATPWGIDVLGVGYAEILPGQTYPPSAHPPEHYFEWERGRALPEYQALLVTSGAGSIETAVTEPATLEAPFCFLLFPGVWHRYRPLESTGWSEYWIAFDGAHARELQSSGAINPHQPFYPVGHHENILGQMQLAHAEARSEALGFRRICASAIMQILALATTLPLRQQEESHPMRAVVRRACFLMRARAENALSPESVAEELKVGYTYFRRMFKRYTGMSPKRYHSQLRLQRVKSLLRHTNLGVAEIAQSLEFDTPFHLSSWFKKHTGLSPRDWRAAELPQSSDDSPRMTH